MGSEMGLGLDGFWVGLTDLGLGRLGLFGLEGIEGIWVIGYFGIVG